jgi:hypothetical protein
MPLVVKDRVRETTTTLGTGTITLAGAVAGFQSFSAIGNANTTYYTINLPGANEWEVGIGTYTASGTTLSRDTILASSNSGSAVNFSAGTKDVFCTYPAGKSAYLDAANNLLIGTTTNTNTSNIVANGTISETVSGTQYLVASQFDVGTNPNQIPLNQYLGDMAFQSSAGVSVGILAATTIDTTNLEVTNIKAKDGTAAIVLTDSTGAVTISTALTANGGAVFNENGANVDFRVEGDTDANLIFADASADFVGIGTNAPGAKLDVAGNIFATGFGRFGDSIGFIGKASDLVSGGSATDTALRYDGNNLIFSYSNTEKMRLSNATGGVGALGIGYTSLTSVGDSGLAVLGNVGIGTSSPSAKLHTSSSGLGDGGGIKIQNAGAGGATFAIWPTATINGEGAGKLIITGPSGNAVALDSSGNLGIGTASPTAKLTVSGQTVRISYATSNFNELFPTYSVYNTQNSVELASIVSGTGSAANNGVLTFNVASGGTNAERMRLTSTGTLNIVGAGTAGSTQAISFNGSTPVDTLVTTSGGLVGIGTSSPSTKFEVVKQGNSSGGTMMLTGSKTNDAIKYGYMTGAHYTSDTNAQGIGIIGCTALSGENNISIGGDPGEFLAATLIKFYTAANSTTAGGSERARITSGGGFLVGRQAAIGSELLCVEGSNADFLSRIRNTSATTPAGLFVSYTAAAPNGTGSLFLRCDDSAATRAEIRSNGGLANYQSNNVDLSDARTKTDINPLGSYWSKIAGLEIVTYKYKDQTHDDLNIGVIAQQVEAVAPEFVDSDGFGDTPEDGVPLKTIYNKDLTFAAIKALQEAMARIETLEAEVAALKGA